jgi:glutamate/tyrosine decarboxylase-like PLP-dependent enzyme
VLCGEDSHTSLEKASMVMGLPAEALQRLPLDSSGRLRPDAVEYSLRALAARGRPVIALVATAGTTVRGAVDPLPDLAAICRRHGVWLHVDAAIGGVLGLSERHRHRVEGLGLADSLTVNPQKLLGITKTSSLLLLADPSALERCFGTGLPYMETSREGGHGGECGLQGTRGAEILKLWLGLRQLGLEGIEGVISGAIGRRRQLRRCLEAAIPAGELTLLSGPLHLLAFRPSSLDASDCSRWSERCRHDLLARNLMLSRPRYQGHHHLKAVLGNPHTLEAHLEQIASTVAQSLQAHQAPA